jgi:hypothetical protein
MFFNRPVLETIRKMYGVGSAPSSWQRLPDKARTQLSSRGFGPTHYPQAYKQYFDTLQVLIFLAVAEGFPYRFTEECPAVSVPSDRLFHVGAVSYWAKLECTWEVRGAYFSQKALELCGDDTLREYYYQRYGRMLAREVLAKFPDAEHKIGPAFFECADKLIARGLEG